MKELVENIKALMTEWAVDADANVVGNKAAGVRARKKSLEITELLKNYRKESVK